MSDDEPNFSPAFVFHDGASRRADEGGADAPHVAPERRIDAKFLTLLPASDGAARKDPPPPAASSFAAFANFRAAAALALALGLGAGGALWLDRREGGAAMQAEAAQSGADALKRAIARLDALEGRSEGDSRKLAADVKSAVASAKDLNGALAQLGARLDKADQAQNARLDKLSDRLDRDALGRLAAAAPDKRAAIEFTPAPAQSAAASAAPRPPAPVAAVKADPGISNEPTGSIEKPHPALAGFSVLDVRDGVALLRTRDGPQEVSPGDYLPGAGRIERVERRGRQWAVVTSNGVILGD